MYGDIAYPLLQFKENTDTANNVRVKNLNKDTPSQLYSQFLPNYSFQIKKVTYFTSYSNVFTVENSKMTFFHGETRE